MPYPSNPSVPHYRYAHCSPKDIPPSHNIPPIKAQIQKERIKLANLTRENTQKLNSMAELLEAQRSLEDTLNHRQKTMVYIKATPTTEAPPFTSLHNTFSPLTGIRGHWE